MTTTEISQKPTFWYTVNLITFYEDTFLLNLIDSHCHLNFNQFKSDRELVLARATEAGITCFINPAVDLTTSREALALAHRYPNVYAAVGFHPYSADKVNDETLAILADIAQDENVVAIGEIGLDFYRDRTSKSDQYRAFESQLTLAQNLDLPVIIHQRDAAEDTMSILKTTEVSKTSAVLHAYSGNIAVEEVVSLGFYMGIGGPITFKNAKGFPDIVATIPLNRLIVETDSPFLSPHPLRGKRNEPARITLIVQKLASIFQCDMEQFAEQITTNTETLFRLANKRSVKDVSFA